MIYHSCLKCMTARLQQCGSAVVHGALPIWLGMKHFHRKDKDRGLEVRFLFFLSTRKALSFVCLILDNVKE